ncbi:Arc-like DNA binding domain-containing protein [Thiothrix eikelboomii]|uniref:Arc-like DNA binding domain-containing protein n=1 Tax=Thiothrix eikelboomii TaxID=92487 RepID=A0A1T4Y5P9_9GAMM|nr:Arc family DNA-binding protein [Thiothrix eikelboomii]SKA96973.1 Arc-like DNA binding domain-containing protein [Thiothrix eikelboomii]
MSRDVNPFGLRLPPELKEELERLAEQNRRSLNAELIVRLEESVQREGQTCITAEEIRQIVEQALAKAGKG